MERSLVTLDAAFELPKNEIVRDAAIQRFKVAYELAWRVIRRHLEWSGVPDVESWTRKDLFREAARAGLIVDAERWFDHDFARNLSFRTYEELYADEVYEAARNFAHDARRLVERLRERLS